MTSWQDFGMSNSNAFHEKAGGLVQHYHSDMEVDLTNETILLHNILSTERHEEKGLNDMLQYIISRNLAGIFPSVCISLQICLSIVATSCEGECSLATMKRVKNYSRVMICQEKMTNFAPLCIES